MHKKDLVLKPKQPGTVIVVDLANLAFRFAFHFKGTMIKLDKNTFVSSGIIYQIINTMFNLHSQYKQLSTILVFEGDKKNNPRYKHPRYKANRPSSKTIDITSELMLIKEIAKLLGILCITPLKGEADDGIAHVASALRLNTKHKVLVLSNDHDMQVLLRKKRVEILKKENKHYTYDDFYTNYGFHPKYFSLLLTIAGDSSDNLLGVRGIGEKKGTQIFKQILEKQLPITPTTIAKQIRKSYTRYKESHSVQELVQIIQDHYRITKLYREWPIQIQATANINNFKWLKSIFEHLRMRQFIKIFPKIIKNVEWYNSHERSIITAIRKQ